MELRWAVATYRGGREREAASKLDERRDPAGRVVRPDGRRAFCPLERIVRTARGRRVELLRPVISGYAFVEGVDDSRWLAAAAVDGFAGFLGPEGAPSPVLGDGLRLLEGLLAAADDEGAIEWPDIDSDKDIDINIFKRGDLVRFRRPLALGTVPDAVEGSLVAASLGVVEWTRPGRATVSFTGLFGHDVRVEVAASAIETAEGEVGASKERRRTLYDLARLAARTTRRAATADLRRPSP